MVPCLFPGGISGPRSLPGVGWVGMSGVMVGMSRGSVPTSWSCNRAVSVSVLYLLRK